MEIELTMALPCTHFRPASMTDHFDESTMMGTREISGSEAIRFRKRVMAASESSIASSMLMSITWAPFSTCWRATDRASSYCSLRIMRANAFEPVTLVRSPTLTNSDSSLTTNGSRPARRKSCDGAGTVRGVFFDSNSPMAAMCSGVVPQQPPAMFRKPASANSRSRAEVSAGNSSKPVSLMGLGKPAFG
ncbi:hypothetical protein D3C81_485470 [compost metagenome]